jgi:hypothetical protein
MFKRALRPANKSAEQKLARHMAAEFSAVVRENRSRPALILRSRDRRSTRSPYIENAILRHRENLGLHVTRARRATDCRTIAYLTVGGAHLSEPRPYHEQRGISRDVRKTYREDFPTISVQIAGPDYESTASGEIANCVIVALYSI